MYYRIHLRRRSSNFILIRTSLVIAGFVALVGCSGNSDNIDLPQGEQEIAGVLRAAEISVTRRGTHLIEIDGVETYYAESALVTLRNYQDKRVTLRGTLEHNISKTDLPVLKVISVVDVEETAKEYVFPAFDLELQAPVEWQSVKREGAIQFRTEDIEDPIVIISQESGDELPEGGVPIVVDATRATRLVDELTGVQIVSVKREGRILTFQFNPRDSVRAARLREDFLELLQSVTLRSDDRNDNETATGTGTLGVPCGGAAGILCPDGFYCEVQDLEENIGRCKSIQ